MPGLAHNLNHRTAVKATIKRASSRARTQMNRLDRRALGQLDKTYRQAAANLKELIHGYAGSDGSLRLTNMQDLLGQVNLRLDQLGRDQNLLIDGGLIEAAQLGAAPFDVAPEVASNLVQVPDGAVRFVRNLVAKDGLQLSDRIWRINNGAKQIVSESIQRSIIQGHGASEAAQALLNQGQPVPADLVKKQGAAQAGGIANEVANRLLTADGNPRANALRVVRTEMNRAHGEAYMMGGENIDGFAGWRFLLSPRHPETDICDMHAKANLHGLGPGVYPSRERNPWPAHPNTLSYVEIVFDDEVTDTDRLGKVDRLDWLKGQPTQVQDKVLNSRFKRAALQKGILKPGEIATPWKVLKEKYIRKGVDVDALKPVPVAVTKLKPPFVSGKVDDGLRTYMTDAFEHAPDEIHGVISNTIAPDSVVVRSGQGSYYQLRNIVLSPRHMKESLFRHSKHTVYRHEYGHHVDFNSLKLKGDRFPSQVSITPDTAGGLGDSMQNAKRSLHARSAAQKARFKDLKERIRDKDGTIQDLFGSLTLNRMGGGHSTSYLKKPGFAETEVFAQLFELYSRQDQAGWKFVAAELPELTDNFTIFIKRTGKT